MAEVALDPASPITQHIVAILRDLPEAEGLPEESLRAVAARMLAEGRLDDATWVSEALLAAAHEAPRAGASAIDAPVMATLTTSAASDGAIGAPLMATLVSPAAVAATAAAPNGAPATTVPVAAPGVTKKEGKKGEPIFAVDPAPSAVCAPMTRAELDEVLETHAKWMRSVLEPDAFIENGRANLKGAVMAGFDLSGVDLRGANLEKADLTGANLTGANFATANLRGATLTGAVLAKAVFRRADLSWADLTGCDLSQADMNHADLRHAKRDKEDPIQDAFQKAFPTEEAAAPA